MKKSLLKKTMLLLFALVTGSTCAWADTVTLSYSGATTNMTDGNNATSVGLSADDWSVTAVPTGAATPLYPGLNTDGSIRLYYNATQSNSITVSASGSVASINSITVTYGTKTSKGVTTHYNGGVVTAGGNVIADTNDDDDIGQYDIDGNTSFTIANGNTSSVQVWIKSIVITYTLASSSPLDHITLSGTYPTEFYVGDEFSHAGMTVTAHFEDTSTSDVTSSATFTGYNMSSTGNQTVTVSYTKGAVTKTAEYGITILPVPTAAVTLDFTDAGWGFPSSDYDTTEKSYTNNGYTITLGAGSTGHKARKNGNDIVSLIFGKSGATLTLPAFGFNVSKIIVYGASNASAAVTFNIFVGDNAVSSAATSSAIDHEFTIAADKRAVGTIYTIKVTNSNNCQISKIEVYGNGCEAGVVTDAGWATYVTTCDMEFAEGDAFVVSAANATTATLTGVTKIRANQPVLLKGEGAKTAKVLDETPAAVSNELAISIGGSIDGFVLAKPAGKSAGFYKWNGGSLTSGKVYLPAPTAARDYLEFTFDDESETTSISEIETMRNVGNETFYNLNGQKVQNPTKGLYIVNGKKVIIK